MYETYRETYESYTMHGLTDLAEIFHANLMAVNTTQHSYGQIRRRQSRPAVSRNVACASSGVMVSLDFSYQANAKEVLDDMHDIDSIIDEGWLCVKEVGELAVDLACVLINLEFEANRFLERRLGSDLRTVDDFMRLPATIAQEFRP